MTTFPDTFTSKVALDDPSQVASTLLADPVSMLLDRRQLTAVADIGLGIEQSTSQRELRILRDCARELDWLRPKLKRAFTTAYEVGDIDAASAQRLIDRFEVWDD